MARRWLDPERLAWLRAEYPRHTVAETLRLFNARFGADVSVSQLRGASKNHKLGRALRPTSLTFDAREEAWLRERLPQAPRADVATAFFAEFGWRPRSVSLDSYASRHGLRGAPNTGRFRPGLAPHNKGRKGRCPPGSEKGWFRKGSLPSGTRPLYAERWSDRKTAAYLEIKIPERNPHTGAATRWIRKAVWIWRQANGPVPAGHVVVQMDGDPANCELSNLDCVPRSVLARMNRRSAPAYAGPEANPARVRRAQLEDAVAGRTA